MGTGRKQRIEEMRDVCIPEHRKHDSTPAQRFIYEKVGFLFTRIFVKTRITPNQITWIWLGLMLFFSSFFLFDCLWIHVAGAIGWIAAYSMDSTDGHVARYKRTYSRRGIFLDTINHSISWPILFFCVGTGQYLVSGEILNIIFGMVAGLFILLILIAPYLQFLVDPDIKDISWARIEEKAFKDKRRYILIRNINPLSFDNILIMLLVATALDLLAAGVALPNLILADELFWITSFLSLFVVLYAVGYVLAFPLRFAVLYRMLK
ncbi:MAG: CDP-alcohol phosphatidyltransferase family protein [Methanomassiliicoccaceae archaeon]|nr:CDP-alcohol phosphatidyltransferase family protein [Methanomassiliicoccaceae archaeon]